MIVKVKEPQPVEIEMLREGQILFTYLHLAPDEAQTQGLMDSGCTAIAHETVTDSRCGLPLLAPIARLQDAWRSKQARPALKSPMAAAVCCWAAYRA